MGKPTLTGEVIKELLLEFPNVYSNSLAKIAYDKHKKLFTSVDHARSIIRYYRGTEGKKNRATLGDKRFLKNPLDLPESDETEYIPFILPKQCKKVLILSDIHVPYHSIPALTAALQYGKDHKADTVVINGDLLDFYHLSRFDKDPRKRHLDEEIDICRNILEKIRKLFPKARIYYKTGNHEERLPTYLKIKAPELLGCDEFRLDVILRLPELNIEFIDEKRLIKVGGLTVLHGHELHGGAFSPVNVARGLFNKSKVSAICGHHHQVSEHTETDLNGDIVTCWSMGCLCELNPAYMPINKWSHGAAFVELNENYFKVHNFRIYNGEIL